MNFCETCRACYDSDAGHPDSECLLALAERERAHEREAWMLADLVVSAKTIIENLMRGHCGACVKETAEFWLQKLEAQQKAALGVGAAR